ncbi:helicase associated domain-containing protein [Streptomyces sp. NPDC057020]|uniref:helicase associated domain-containing protein n=1 Tax=unclassified Streptomyces TaxID=2593676 RepID=UPI00362A3C69
MKLHVTRPTGVSADWATGAAAAADFHNEHAHLAPPRTLPGQSGNPRFLDLPAWLDAQRTARRNGELKDWQSDFLDDIGMVWEPRSETRQLLLTYARQCAEETGGLAVSSGYKTPDGRGFGRDLANLRTRADNRDPDADPTTSDAKGFAALLDALFEIDPYWNPPVGSRLAAPLPAGLLAPQPRREAHPARRQTHLPPVAARPRPPTSHPTRRTCCAPSTTHPPPAPEPSGHTSSRDSSTRRHRAQQGRRPHAAAPRGLRHPRA